MDEANMRFFDASHDHELLLAIAGIRVAQDQEINRQDNSTGNSSMSQSREGKRNTFRRKQNHKVAMETDDSAVQSSLLSCDLCPDKVFKTQINLQIHIRTKHEGNKKTTILPQDRIFPCHLCSGKSFRTQKGRRAHIRVVHEGKKRTFKCPRCGEAFVANRKRWRHVKQNQCGHLTQFEFHKDSATDVEANAAVQGLTTSAAEADKEESIQADPNACGICNKSLISTFDLKRHLQKAHHIGEDIEIKETSYHQTIPQNSVTGRPRSKVRSQVRSEVKPNGKPTLHCPICGKAYISSGSMKEHIKVVHQGYRVTCNICGASMKWIQSLKVHMSKVHHIEQESNRSNKKTCDDCGADFTSAAKLREHLVNVHGQVLLHKCPICEAEFNHATEIGVHKLSHAELVKYQCTLCRRRYISVGAYNRHIKMTKHKQKPGKPLDCTNLSCYLCKRQFATYELLHAHLRDDSNTDRCFVKGKGIKCSVCNRHLSSNKAMQSHQLIAHKIKGKSYKKSKKRCEVCGKMLNYDHYKFHMDYHKGVKHQCQVCDWTTSFPSAMRQHRKKHIGDPSKMYHCKVCNVPWKSKRMCTLHEFTHEEVAKPKCSYCPQEFTSDFMQNEHQKRCEHSKPYQCEVCSQRYRVRSLVDTCEHGKWTKRSCEKCGLSLFRTMDQYDRHVSNCKGLVDLLVCKCSVCSEVFKQKTMAESCEKAHQEFSIYKRTCTVCGKELTSKIAFRKHQQRKECRHHYKVINPMERKCNVCSEEFRFYSLAMRCEESHKLWPDFKHSCGKCGKVLTSLFAYKKHLSKCASIRHICNICFEHFHDASSAKRCEESHRKEPDYMRECPKCKKEIFSKYLYKRHVKSCHKCGLRKRTNSVSIEGKHRAQLSPQSAPSLKQREHRVAMKTDEETFVAMVTGNVSSDDEWCEGGMETLSDYEEQTPSCNNGLVQKAGASGQPSIPGWTAASLTRRNDELQKVERFDTIEDVVKASVRETRLFEEIYYQGKGWTHKCKMCLRMFKNKSEAEACEESHRCAPDYKATCQKCTEEFTSEYSYNNHMDRHKVADRVTEVRKQKLASKRKSQHSAPLSPHSASKIKVNKKEDVSSNDAVVKSGDTGDQVIITSTDNGANKTSESTNITTTTELNCSSETCKKGAGVISDGEPRSTNESTKASESTNASTTEDLNTGSSSETCEKGARVKSEPRSTHDTTKTEESSNEATMTDLNGSSEIKGQGDEITNERSSQMCGILNDTTNSNQMQTALLRPHSVLLIPLPTLISLQPSGRTNEATNSGQMHTITQQTTKLDQNSSSNEVCKMGQDDENGRNKSKPAEIHTSTKKTVKGNDRTGAMTMKTTIKTGANKKGMRKRKFGGSLILLDVTDDSDDDSGDDYSDDSSEEAASGLFHLESPEGVVQSSVDRRKEMQEEIEKMKMNASNIDLGDESDDIIILDEANSDSESDEGKCSGYEENSDNPPQHCKKNGKLLQEEGKVLRRAEKYCKKSEKMGEGRTDLVMQGGKNIIIEYDNSQVKIPTDLVMQGGKNIIEYNNSQVKIPSDRMTGQIANEKSKFGGVEDENHPNSFREQNVGAIRLVLREKNAEAIRCAKFNGEEFIIDINYNKQVQSPPDRGMETDVVSSNKERSSEYDDDVKRLNTMQSQDATLRDKLQSQDATLHDKLQSQDATLHDKLQPQDATLHDKLQSQDTPMHDKLQSQDATLCDKQPSQDATMLDKQQTQDAKV